VVVDGVGPGTVLAGRFTVDSLVRDEGGAQRWTASEPDLRRSVGVVVLPSGDDRAPALLDAARVAAGLDIAGCVRILDIGSDERVAWVVEESLEDARSVAELVHGGGLPGDEVRRIAGEAATALEAASARGVHHLRLAPEEVFRTADGMVKVRGLATEAALARVEEDSSAAARTDAIGLVGVTYAALTGLWPLSTPGSALPDAPRPVHGVPAPSEIAAGVPRDIDTLCRLTLGDGGGPSTPGDYARQIAPWSSRQIIGRSTLPPAAASAVTAVAAKGESAESSAAPEPTGEPTAKTPPTAPSDAAAATRPEGPADGDPATGADAAGATGATSAAAVAGPVAAGAAVGAGTAPVGATGTTSATSTDRAEDARSAASGSPRPSGSVTARATTPEGLEPPAPGIPAEPLTKDESKVALSIVGAFVLLSLLVGLWGVSKIGSQSSFDLSVGAKPTTKASASASPSASETGPQPLAILSADGFDPLGDRRENNQLAPKVFDGDPATAWTSEGYRTPNLGGIKSGVGVIVDLGPNITAKQVNLTLGAPADVEVYFAADRSLDNALKIGQQAGANGTVSLPVPAEAAGRQYVIVWFTSLTQVDGAHRAVLGEVGVLG
jgi:hypothetical protein